MFRIRTSVGDVETDSIRDCKRVRTIELSGALQGSTFPGQDSIVQPHPSRTCPGP